MMDEGYIKYAIDWIEGPPPEEDMAALISARNQLYQMGLIGIYEEEGIGYGNVSQRLPKDEFLISGTQTGGIPVLGPSHFCRVLDWNLETNSLRCLGPLKASSESLTHAAIYACDPDIQVILHIHQEATWRKMLERFPSTAPDVAYGTPEMAREVYRLFQETSLKDIGMFAMGGHFEGIFSFGKNVPEALERLVSVVI